MLEAGQGKRRHSKLCLGNPCVPKGFPLGVQWTGQLHWKSRGDEGLHRLTSESGGESALPMDTVCFLFSGNFTTVGSFNSHDNPPDPILQLRTLRHRLPC